MEDLSGFTGPEHRAYGMELPSPFLAHIGQRPKYKFGWDCSYAAPSTIVSVKFLHENSRQFLLNITGINDGN
jgi:hypothetical protein